MTGPRLLSAALAALAVAPAALAQSPDAVASSLGLADVQVVEVELAGLPGQPASAWLSIDGEPQLLQLTPHSVRSAEHFQVVEQRADGSYVPVAVPAPRTYRGQVPGLNGAPLAASWLDDGLHARVALPDGDTLWIEPLVGRFAGASSAAHAVYRGSDVLPDPTRTCGVDAPFADGTDLHVQEPGVFAGTQLKVAEVAIDTDFEYYQSKGSSSTNVTNAIESVVNAMNDQYEDDVAITHEISTIIVRTTSNDPYTTTDAGGLLSQLRNHWNSQQTSVQRDVVHMFTGKNLAGGTIGVAYLGVVCKKNSGYGLVQSDCCGSFSSKTDLSAHELGHNWSAGHCNCVGWTMNPFLTSANQFNPSFTINKIVSYANNQSCLDDGVGTTPCVVTQYGTGLGGANVGTLSSTTDPEIGASFVYNFDGFAGFPFGLLVVSGGQDNSPLFGGTLLVSLALQVKAFPVQAVFGQGAVLFPIPDDPALLGVALHAQLGLADASQPQGFSFTNGLSIVICD